MIAPVLGYHVSIAVCDTGDGVVGEGGLGAVGVGAVGEGGLDAVGVGAVGEGGLGAVVGGNGEVGSDAVGEVCGPCDVPLAELATPPQPSVIAVAANKAISSAYRPGDFNFTLPGNTVFGDEAKWRIEMLERAIRHAAPVNHLTEFRIRAYMEVGALP
jgi:hypothetical protein